MPKDLDSLLPEVTMRSPLSSGEMEDFVKKAGKVPHQDYLDFMKRHNGCDGPVGKESYVRIWTLSHVLTGTAEAGTGEFAPGLLLFGGDGGDTAYAFDRCDPDWPIVSVSLSAMSRDEMQPVAKTFSEFIRRLAADELL